MDWCAWHPVLGGEPRVIDSMPTLAELNAEAARRQLVSGSGMPLSFVPPDDRDVGYERRAFDKGEVNTRPDNWHDAFNALIWLHFPQAKRRLNQLQAAQIAVDGVRCVRGPVRDAITVFDENAALLQAPDALWDALAARDWQGLFIGRRTLWAQARLSLFGHALLEKLVHPRKAITAHVLRVPLRLAIAEVDGWLARELSAERLAAKPFVPLPVLGVPGWWPANEVSGFYVDEQVFRPPRI